MTSIRSIKWRKLPVSLTELCLDTTLRCGQSFRWQKSDDDIWSCALKGRILSLRQDSTHLHYHATHPSGFDAPLTPPSSAPASTIEPLHDDEDTEELVQHYLNLEPHLTELYEQWSKADLNFKKRAPKFAGVRILKQDAWEALVGFICSSNNNIIRISQMACPLRSMHLTTTDSEDLIQMEKLCVHYGPLIGYLDSKPFYDMPSPSALIDSSVELHLRQLGFGYRAKYLHQTALMVSKDHEAGWLDSLRNPESPVMGGKISDAGEMLPGGRDGYRSAHAELLSLQGVGPKVADCVCLMGLGWGEAVPVDTHVWQIAQRDYRFGKGKHRSLTKATYDAVGDLFRSLWGKQAGWAHSVLFAADLRTFAERLSTKLEVTEVKKEEGVELSTKLDITKVKKEEDVEASIETVSKTSMSTGVGVKRELTDEEKTLITIQEVSLARKVKRRRKV